MLVKVTKLTGAALDWAVAKCEGFTTEYEEDRKDFWINRTNDSSLFLPPFGYLKDVFYPSSDWSQGGPIIEREGVNLKQWQRAWTAELEFLLDDDAHYRYGKAAGPTPLIASMRCYVASKLGNSVDVPDELSDPETKEALL